MGRVRTKTVKKAARTIIEKYYPRLTLDFHVNKRICAEVALIPSKRMRNKIAGYVTHLMKRIQKGPVRGISFKLQVCIFDHSFTQVSTQESRRFRGGGEREKRNDRRCTVQTIVASFVLS